MSKYFFKGTSMEMPHQKSQSLDEHSKIRLGTERLPATANVQTEQRLLEVTEWIKDSNWVVDITIDPGEPEDISQLKQLLNTPQSATSAKVERNAPCPCGSGKKYKKCCGA